MRSLRRGIPGILLAALVLSGCPAGEPPPEDGAATPEAPAADSESVVEPFEAVLYFPGDGRSLRGERRSLERMDSPREQARRIVEALIEGPEQPGLHAPLPPTTRVAGLFLRPERRRVLLDLRSPEGKDPPPSGSRRELLAVYSLVNSLVLNLEEVEEVVLLWNGRQERSFAGHVDTAHPLVAERSLIEDGPVPDGDAGAAAE